MASTRVRATGALLALLVLAGCTSPSEDPAAAAAVQAQIRSLTTDDELAPSEVAALDRTLDRAHQLGIPANLLNPSHDVVTAGKATPETLKTALRLNGRAAHDQDA